MRIPFVVPAGSALITSNLFSGKKKTYGFGVHFRYLWEQVFQKNINMSTRHLTFEGSFFSKDSAKVSINGILLYEPLLSELPTYISIDKSAFKFGALSLLQSDMHYFIATSSIGNKPYEINKIKQPLKEYLLTNHKEDFAIKYGVDIIGMSSLKVEHEDIRQKMMKHKDFLKYRPKDFFEL